MVGRAGELTHERIDPLKIDVNSVTAVMSYAYAARFNILALDVKPSHVVIATADPYVTEWQQELEGVVHKEIRRVIASPVEIERYLLEFYALARSVQRASPKESDGGTQLQNLEQLMELGRAGGLDANDHHVVSIVDWLLQYAMEQRASDIHLEPRRNQSTVRFRIDGVLHPVYEIPTPVMAGVISRIKILGRMDVAEKRRPQDGRLKTRTPHGKEVELRLSTMPTAFGEKVVMRIFNPEVLVKDLAALGITAALATMERDDNSPHGIILVTGPTGSGKTTTLYSALKSWPPRKSTSAPSRIPSKWWSLRSIRCRCSTTSSWISPRRPDPAASGPGHHHGRRDPRSGNRGNGNPGGADRSPGAVHPAHQ